ncbi:MAG TPA: hydroxyacid-oxoacid transhydrogenase [Bryobacteraceae bacterium]|jgi:hydroxyacid-oxoacid transhydrogenase|nr:hydroxyacid-oxoacid transhydrogenase [Bryobacteraceae bacterium]
MQKEFAFEMAAASIRFGAGATSECGADLADLGARNVLVFTDAALVNLPPVASALASLKANGVSACVFDRVRVEPNTESVEAAIAFATNNEYDAVLAIGGGSTIDTAKIANLYSCWPADFLDYVNQPIGKGKPVPGPVKPLLAIPTTAGTGSETTGVAIFDYKPLKAKTGIAHRRLKPLLGIVDPENTRTLPPAVAASSGLDVLCHAIESFTAIPFSERPKPERPIIRPAYQGSNPISDIWSLEALRLCATYLRRALADSSDEEARGAMLLASSYAGIGFGNAGVHLPHGMSYPVAGLIRDWRAPGYNSDHAIVPHGISVILNAPAVFRFTACANPERHLRAAQILGANIERARPEDAGSILSDQLIALMHDLRMPNGLGELGYINSDIPALVDGTLPQHRVTKLSPRAATREDLARLFEESMKIW